MVTPWLWFVVSQVTCRFKWRGVPWLLGVWLKSEMQIGPGPDRNFLEKRGDFGPIFLNFKKGKAIFGAIFLNFKKIGKAYALLYFLK